MRTHCTMMYSLVTGPHRSADLNLHRCKSQGIFSVKITSVLPDSEGGLTESDQFMPGALLQIPETSPRTDQQSKTAQRREHGNTPWTYRCCRQSLQLRRGGH